MRRILFTRRHGAAESFRDFAMILTDNGAQFTHQLLAEHLRPKDKMHPFDALCTQHDITHRLTKFRHPWTNGQVEVMNRIIKNHTTKNYYYETAEALKKHLAAFIMAYNYQRPLRALKFLSPYDKIIDIWNQKPHLFHINPYHKIPGLNNQKYPHICGVNAHY